MSSKYFDEIVANVSDATREKVRKYLDDAEGRVGSFDWEHFKHYVNSYDPKEHAGDNPNIIFDDMLYGLGMVIDGENHRDGDGYRLFKSWLLRRIWVEFEYINQRQQK